MKSIKPGKMPSLVGAAGSIFVILFGIFWTTLAPGYMKIAGVLFVLMACIQAYVHFHNASVDTEDRLSLYDIVEEEQKPHEEVKKEDISEDFSSENLYCPYCGAKMEKEFLFCRHCGKKLP